LEFLSADFDRGFEHETRCHNVFSRLLTQDQKDTRLTLCQELKNQIESDSNFLSSSGATKVGAMGTTLRPNKLRPKKAIQVR